MPRWAMVGALAMCASSIGLVGSAAAQVQVVVTSKPIHALVAGVMTGVGKPLLLVDGNSSPHNYALKPSDAKALNAADVVFRVSDGLEPFTVKVFKSLPKSVRTISLAETPGLTLLAKREGGAFEAHGHGGKGRAHSHGHGRRTEDRSPRDPHVWLDPDNARKIVDFIASQLSAASPKDAAAFMANAVKIGGRLDALDAKLQRELKPVAGKPFVVFHDSLQYLEARYGLTAAGSITVSPDDQPSARRLSDLRSKISGLGAVCVFSEPQFPGKLVGSLIEGTKAKTAVIDPEGGTIAAGPDLYFELMRKAAASLKGCLAG